MYLKVGKMVKRQIVTMLLSAVPAEDLNELKSIYLKSIPPKSYRKQTRFWGGLMGVHLGSARANNSRIQLYMWGISKSVLDRFRCGNSNAYHSFLNQLANTLYHEIGHHVHSKTDEYAKLETERERLMKTWRKAINKSTAPEEEKSKTVQQLNSRLSEIGSAVEDYAKKYAEAIMKNASELGLLDDARPVYFAFFKVQFDHFVHECMDIYERNRGNKGFVGMWGQITGIFEYLRKQKVGNGAKYTVAEAFEAIFNVPSEPKLVAKFKIDALKLVKPYFYISKSGRKFAHFTQAQVEQLRTHFKNTPKSENCATPIGLCSA